MHTILYKRNITGEVLKYLDSRPAIVIYGSRQVGKTSFMKYLMKNHIKDNTYYLDLELPGLLDVCNAGAESVYDYLQQKGADEKRKIYLLVDEIQYLHNPTGFIKVIHDHYPQVKLIVSGSSTFEIRKKFRESLAGRTVNFELYPLSFEEFLRFKGLKYKLRKENSDSINRELIPLAREFIRFGGYPGIVLENSEDKKLKHLSQIINTYIRKDIRDIGRIRDITAFNNLIEVLAGQSGQLLNVSEISNTLGINRETATEYIELLEKTFIIKRLRPFHKNLRSELTKNPKVFFIDTGMMHLLWLKEFPKVVLGGAFETFVFSELLKAGQRVNFWRTTNKQEVDFIMPGKQPYGVEAKLNFQSSGTKNLSFFSEQYNCKAIVTGLKGRKQGKYPWELLVEVSSGER